MLKQKNSKMQGNVGLGSAIQYFTSNGYVVSIPMNDSQSYDLVVDTEGGLRRVQVKTTTRKKDSSWEVGLRKTGGNKSSNTRSPLDRSSFDLLFILAENGSRWLIPAKEIQGTSSITVGDNLYKRFSIQCSGTLVEGEGRL